ncbi:hypothetical protein JCM3774_004660 [Rhodotorula dairenensis]
MLRLLSDMPRLFVNAARPCRCIVAVPPPGRPSSAPPAAALRSISTALFSQPALRQPRSSLVAAATSSIQASVFDAGQTRGFKMPRSMRKVSSPVARNTGKGKTARKHSARSAKRRRMRRGKIN